MMGQHHKLINQIDKALSLLSKKVYVDVLCEIDPTQNYSLLDLLRLCKNELSKLDERELLKISKAVQKELK